MLPWTMMTTSMLDRGGNVHVEFAIMPRVAHHIRANGKVCLVMSGAVCNLRHSSLVHTIEFSGV
jgi:hypothetical protein